MLLVSHLSLKLRFKSAGGQTAKHNVEENTSKYVLLVHLCALQVNYLFLTLRIVPFVATPLKGRFVVFLQWLFIGYFRLG